jgi:GNAT superfamily N-acetyltransferase
MITRATTLEEFRAVERLMAALRALDEAESAKLGIAPESIAFYYTDRTADALERRFSRPEAVMFVLHEAGAIVGCGGLVEDGEGGADLQHVFVDPDRRGKGLGLALVAHLIDEARARGVQELRLETAGFLTAAIALYHRLGFRDCVPFADTPPELQEMSVFMSMRP